MLCDFGVIMTIPSDRLCPPVCASTHQVCVILLTIQLSQVPNRLNYVLWIQDMVSASKQSPNTPAKKIHGIDMYGSHPFPNTIELTKFFPEAQERQLYTHFLLLSSTNTTR